ncbi:hypothetical protein ABPG74_011110 [Tetrahymena malaccensis]
MGQLNFGKVQTKHNFVGTRASHQFIQPQRKINVKMSHVDKTLSVFTLTRTDTTIDLSFYAEKDKIQRGKNLFCLIRLEWMGQLNFGKVQTKHNFVGTRASHQFIQPQRKINVKMSHVDKTLSVFTLIRTDTTIDLSFYAEKDKIRIDGIAEFWQSANQTQLCWDQGQPLVYPTPKKNQCENVSY